jgi:hypothetical protein
MAKQWCDDQAFLIEAIPDYRRLIENKELNDARRLTLKFAQELHYKTPELQHRSIEAIAQRMPYLDNLLAGVFTKQAYGIKDQILYNTQNRENNSVEPNVCNTRHSYNGVMKKYMQDLVNCEKER